MTASVSVGLNAGPDFAGATPGWPGIGAPGGGYCGWFGFIRELLTRGDALLSSTIQRGSYRSHASHAPFGFDRISQLGERAGVHRLDVVGERGLDRPPLDLQRRRQMAVLDGQVAG